MIRRIRRFVSARWPIYGSLFRPLRTTYKAHSARSDEEFGRIVQRNSRHPVKLKTLDLLIHDKNLPETFTLLDVGCGAGVLANMVSRDPILSERATYHGIDQSKDAVDFCRRTYADNLTFDERDVLESGFPDDKFDVIIINEVLEHVSNYEDIISMAFDRNPSVLAIGNFAVLPELKNHRRLWRKDTECYMNSYSFSTFYNYLRMKANCPMFVFDYGTKPYDRYWFPRKALTGFYLSLANGNSD